MSSAEIFAEVWRDDILESVHRGHAVICDASGDIVESWGNPAHVTLPRSSCKMVQALPLVDSGAARAAGLTSEHLALACASHNGAAIHRERVTDWLASLGMADADLRCGPQEPNDRDERDTLIRAHGTPCQIHNNCSGKHSGFLTYTKHIGAGPEYIDPDHPTQIAVRAAFEEVTGEASPGYGIDGCSAPNFATSLHGLARGMAAFAAAEGGDARSDAMIALREAMMEHPELVAGEGRSCTNLMREMKGQAAIKTGADGVFIAILPEKKLGVALKIEDGATRGSECAIAAILSRLGVLDAGSAAARRYMNAPLLNRRGIDCGVVKPGSAFT